MKTLVATKETQKHRQNDFSYAKEGELVRFGFECDREAVDGDCGCRRSMVGIESSKSTTTMKIVKTNMTQVQFENEILKSLIKAGWQDKNAKLKGNDLVIQDTQELTQIANTFLIGTIIEKRGNILQERKI